jgi:hypothetical protein
MIAQLIAESYAPKQREEPISIYAESKSRTWSALDVIARGTLTREQALTVYKVTEEDLSLFEPRWRDLRAKSGKE